jgi:hypothetical protein
MAYLRLFAFSPSTSITAYSIHHIVEHLSQHSYNHSSTLITLSINFFFKDPDQRNHSMKKFVFASKNCSREAPEGDSYQTTSALCNAGCSGKFQVFLITQNPKKVYKLLAKALYAEK